MRICCLTKVSFTTQILKASFLSLLFSLPAAAKEITQVCQTTCGMRVLTTSAKCWKLQEFEDLTLEAFQHHVKGWQSRKKLCRALNGWNMVVHIRTVSDPCPAPGWQDTSVEGELFCVVGQTHEETHTLEIDTDNWGNSTLAHEMVHAIDDTFFGPYHGHCDWKIRGVGEALQEATGFYDTGRNSKEVCPGGK